MHHQAAWLPAKHATLEIGSATTPTPGPGELLVKVKVNAFSPIESKLQTLEVHPLTYPNILGLSFAGTVEAVGPDVKDFSAGDRVATLRQDNKLNDSRFGSFQQYALASTRSTAKIEFETSFEVAAGTIANLVTVAALLSVSQGLDRPDVSKRAEPNGKKILVYGGSSSCGGLAISYVTAAGYEVVTTSSPKNRSFVQSLGPAAIIDHTKPAEEIVEEIKVNGPYHRILDNIGMPPVTKILYEYISSIGGGSYNTLIPLLVDPKELPENVEAKFDSYGWLLDDPKYEEFRHWFYTELIPKGLSSGIIVPTPIQWVEGGLKNAQHALDLMDQGKVSGHKLVMDPWQ